MGARQILHSAWFSKHTICLGIYHNACLKRASFLNRNTVCPIVALMEHHGNSKGTGDRGKQIRHNKLEQASKHGNHNKQRVKGLERRGEQFLEVRKALEMPMQDTGTARERKLAKRSVLEAEPAAANCASREREFSARVSREQDTSKAKENLNNLGTKALGREAMSSCASGNVTIHLFFLRGVIVETLVRTISANSEEFENGCRSKRVKDTKVGVASMTDSVSTLMKKCWSRRSSRGNDAGLACGRQQVKRVESADAAQRRGAVECPRQRVEESACQVDWRALSAHRWVRQRTSHNRSAPQVTIF